MMQWTISEIVVDEVAKEEAGRGEKYMTMSQCGISAQARQVRLLSSDLHLVIASQCQQPPSWVALSPCQNPRASAHRLAAVEHRPQGYLRMYIRYLRACR